MDKDPATKTDANTYAELLGQGILFEDPPNAFLFAQTPSPGTTWRWEAFNDPRGAVRILAPLLLAAMPELLSGPGSAMATWVAAVKIRTVPNPSKQDGKVTDGLKLVINLLEEMLPTPPSSTCWLMSFERGSLEGIKIREIEWTEVVAAGGLFAVIRAAAQDPLKWFPIDPTTTAPPAQP